MDNPLLIGVLIGMILGAYLFNKKIRDSFNAWVSKALSSSKAQPSTGIVYIRKGGGHYHVSKRCPLLDGEQFEQMGYYPVRLSELDKTQYKPCAKCARS